MSRCYRSQTRSNRHSRLSGENAPSLSDIVAATNPTLWARASYGGSPWVPVVGGNLSATNAPDVGSALNGLTPADFNGTNDRLTLAGTQATYFSQTQWTAGFLVNVDTAGVFVSNNAMEPIFSCNGTGRTGVGFSDDGAGTRLVRMYQFNGVSADSVTKAITFGSWVFVKAKFSESAGKLFLGTDGGAYTEASASPMSAANLSQTMQMGMGVLEVNDFFDGKCAEVILWNTAVADSTITSFLAYVNNRYALSLS